MRVRLVAGVMVALLVGPMAGSGPAAQAQAPSRSDALIKAMSHRVDLSPDGDRRRDTADVGFALAEPAAVSVVVRRGHDVVRGPVRLGRLSTGPHHWWWDGRNDAGRVVRDGHYRVMLRATAGAQPAAAEVAAVVDTRAPRGSVVTTRPTVYPRATLVDDRVEIVFLTRGWSAYDQEYGSLRPLRAALRIRDAHGRTVLEATRHSVTPQFAWAADRPDDSPLPAGDYSARLRVADPAGNRRTWVTPLHVSNSQLVEEVWSSTVSAGLAGGYEPYYGGCNGCGDFCAPVDSTRFPGGLSFAPCRDFGLWTARYFASGVPFAAAPVDSYRVTATGGATSPLVPAEARLVVGEREAVPILGEGSTSSPWIGVDLDHQPYLPDLASPVVWYFSTDVPRSYDVASFTIEYRHFVPAP